MLSNPAIEQRLPFPLHLGSCCHMLSYRSLSALQKVEWRRNDNDERRMLLWKIEFYGRNFIGVGSAVGSSWGLVRKVLEKSSNQKSFIGIQRHPCLILSAAKKIPETRPKPHKSKLKTSPASYLHHAGLPPSNPSQASSPFQPFLYKPKRMGVDEWFIQIFSRRTLPSNWHKTRRWLPAFILFQWLVIRDFLPSCVWRVNESELFLLLRPRAKRISCGCAVVQRSKRLR